MARAKSVILGDKHKKYVEGVLDGKSKRKAAYEAGFANPPPSTEIAEVIAEKRQELSDATQIRRADVLDMFKEAYEMSKLMSETPAMIAAAREIGRMLGFYEPEKIKVELNHSQASMQAKLLSMSDEDLLAIASGNATVIDGECRRVN
jgi:hypothetical protein